MLIITFPEDTLWECFSALTYQEESFLFLLDGHISRKYVLPFGKLPCYSALFIPLINVIIQHEYHIHSYADDTQLYISSDPNDQ